MQKLIKNDSENESEELLEKDFDAKKAEPAKINFFDDDNDEDDVFRIKRRDIQLPDELEEKEVCICDILNSVYI